MLPAVDIEVVMWWRKQLCRDGLFIFMTFDLIGGYISDKKRGQIYQKKGANVVIRGANVYIPSWIACQNRVPTGINVSLSSHSRQRSAT